MAGIDLVPLLGNNAPGIAGQYISGFGQSLERLGTALLAKDQQEKRVYNAQQQALLDTEEARQIMQAKSLAYSNIEAFNQGLDSNLDYQRYVEMWGEQKTALQDQLSSVLTLPTARQKFDEWWIPAQDKQIQYVYGETRKRTVAAAQATFTVSIDQLAQEGNEQGIYDAVKQGVASGVYSASEASEIAKGKIPEARFNRVYSYLDKNEKTVDIIDELSKEGAAEKWNLSPEQLTSMLSKFTDKQASQTRLTEARIKEQQEQTFTKLVTDSSDPKTMPTRENVTKAMVGLISSPYYNQAKQLRDSIDAETERIATAAKEKGETRTYSSMKTSMLMWDGNGNPPWDPTVVDILVSEESPLNITLTKGDADKLNSLYESTMKDIQAGTRIGPMFVDPVKENELWKIALDVNNHWDSTTKKDLINRKAYLGNGVPGPKLKAILEAADDSENATAKTRYYKYIQDWYGAVLSKLSQNKAPDAEIQLAAYKESNALQTLRRVMIDNPKSEETWARAVDDMMMNDITKEVSKMVEDKLGATFPGFFLTGVTSNEMRLNAAIEQFPELKNNPKFAAEYKAAIPVIESEERDVLAKNGIKNITAAKQAPNGDMNYQTSDGSIYKVVQENVNGKIKSVVYKVVNKVWVRQ